MKIIVVKKVYYNNFWQLIFRLSIIISNYCFSFIPVIFLNKDHWVDHMVLPEIHSKLKSHNTNLSVNKIDLQYIGLNQFKMATQLINLFSQWKQHTMLPFLESINCNEIQVETLIIVLDGNFPNDTSHVELYLADGGNDSWFDINELNNDSMQHLSVITPSKNAYGLTIYKINKISVRIWQKFFQKLFSSHINSLT